MIMIVVYPLIMSKSKRSRGFVVVVVDVVFCFVCLYIICNICISRHFVINIEEKRTK